MLVDDKNYWKARHKNTDNLKASGIKSVGVKSNHYIYKMLTEQYKKILSQLDLKSISSVIDSGFGDGYFLDFFTKHISHADLYGIDISPEAKKKVNFKPKSNLFVGDLSSIEINRKFDLVHCFDVLYHILDDQDYTDSLANLANLSNKYVILHERFLDKTPKIASRHVRLRTAEFTTQVLNSQGFFLIKEIPTHFFAMRILTYKLNKIVPQALYTIDNLVANRLHPSTQGSLASHKIRVYAKAR